MNTLRVILCMFCTCVLIGKGESTAKLLSLRVMPQNILLDNKDDDQSVIAQAIFSDQISRDVLDQLKIEFSDPTICFYKEGRFYPLKNGQTKVAVSYNTQVVNLSVKCQNVEHKEDLSFGLHIMPIFTKVGCNTGACHGSSRGQDKFRLSLFGFDPKGDYERLSSEFPSRRINLSVAQDSMILTKAIQEVPHTGGKLFDKKSKEYQTLLAWLKEGASQDKKDIKKAIELEFFPTETVQFKGDTQHLSVRVIYSDGSDADVSDLCSFISSDETVVSLNDKGRIEGKKEGEAYLMVRFGTLTALTQIINLNPEAKEVRGIPEVNFIDKLSNKKWRELRLPPSGRCSDQVFLRRVYIDITGGLPREKVYYEFMKDKSLDKRKKLVENLLEGDEFIDLWAMQWAELLQIRSFREFSYKNTLLYFNWLKGRMKAGMPLNEIVYDLLTASGHSFENPAANFYQLETKVEKRTENIAQIFMGRQIQCAQCHNHPFDRWSMNDYYGFAAFFAQVGMKSAEDPRASIIYDKRKGGLKHPLTKKALEPVFLGGEKADIKGRDRREVLATWLTNDQNPYFAPNVANRLWNHFFGRGIIEPIDDARLSNPPSNGALLKALAEQLIKYEFDVKKLVRDICLSNTYQRTDKSLSGNVMDKKNFSRAQVRRMRAEILLDCISQVTKTKDKFRALPTGARAVEIADGNSGSHFLTTFGRASRDTACACEVSVDPNLSQALHLLNGDTVNKKVVDGGLIKKWLDEKISAEKIIKRLYIRCYSRKPSSKELETLLQRVQGAQNKKECLEDIFWALLNSREFIFVR